MFKRPTEQRGPAGMLSTAPLLSCVWPTSSCMTMTYYFGRMRFGRRIPSARTKYRAPQALVNDNAMHRIKSEQ